LSVISTSIGTEKMPVNRKNTIIISDPFCLCHHSSEHALLVNPAMMSSSAQQPPAVDQQELRRKQWLTPDTHLWCILLNLSTQCKPSKKEARPEIEAPCSKSTRHAQPLN
jgi:hypothetical protein